MQGFSYFQCLWVLFPCRIQSTQRHTDSEAHNEMPEWYSVVILYFAMWKYETHFNIFSFHKNLLFNVRGSCPLLLPLFVQFLNKWLYLSHAQAGVTFLLPPYVTGCGPSCQPVSSVPLTNFHKDFTKHSAFCHASLIMWHDKSPCHIAHTSCHPQRPFIRANTWSSPLSAERAQVVLFSSLGFLWQSSDLWKFTDNLSPIFSSLFCLIFASI